MNQSKIFNVKQAAKFLGKSPMTIRRLIQDGILSARLGSKREGYKITEDALIDYANSIKNKVGSFWTDDYVISGATITGVASILSNKSTVATITNALIGGVIGGILGNIIEGNSSQLTEHRSSNDYSDSNVLNDPNVLQQIIFRLNEEVEYYDFLINNQEDIVKQYSEDPEDAEQLRQQKAALFKLKDEQFRLKKEILDLKVRKAICESSQNKNNTNER